MIADPWREARTQAYSIGQLIRRTRTLAGMTQDELGALIGVGAPFMSRIERGETIPFTHQAVTLSAWIEEQTRLQTSESDATGTPALPPHIVTPTPSRATHPDTSRKAMDSINRDNAWAIHNWIIDALTQHREGMTHEQLWEHCRSVYTGPPRSVRSSQSGLRTRVSELVRGGVVEDSGRTRTMTTGRQAIVWQLTESNPRCK